KEKNLENKKYARYFEKKDFLKLIHDDTLDLKVDGIIHMGACSSTTLQDAQYFEENNYLYTRALAQWALRHGVRFVYASSAATYGDGSAGYRDDDATTRRCAPLNLYGASKQKFDLWVLDQRLADRMAGLKFFNVFGPNEYHKGDMRSIAAKSYPRVAGEGKMVLFKSYKPEYRDGEQKRDFIYVKDAVDIVLFFMDHPGINGIFNVGTGHARTWNDLARALFSAVGRPAKIEYIEMPDILKPRYQYFTQADMTKLRGAGYTKPFTTLEDAIADYVPYLAEHRYL
ncbi:MAG TPA: ADP-glyceromanno-heptose 6-epimerase, partial [Candidatus Omnitrophota bacterium]|nr:ADP-glyceromanno-heptose 6-epimerase [Candidatus Omnitrophota bacterium]